jgi:hypothetical protein
MVSPRYFVPFSAADQNVLLLTNIQPSSMYRVRSPSVQDSARRKACEVYSAERRGKEGSLVACLSRCRISPIGSGTTIGECDIHSSGRISRFGG